jgi:hypothetical protein
MEPKKPISVNDRIGIWAAAVYSILFTATLLISDTADDYTIPDMVFAYIIVFVITTITFTGVIYLVKYLNEGNNKILEVLVTYILLLAIMDAANILFGNDAPFSELYAHSIIMTICVTMVSFLMSGKNDKGE